jgi:hypothetical protein
MWNSLVPGLLGLMFNLFLGLEANHHSAVNHFYSFYPKFVCQRSKDVFKIASMS